MAWADDGSIVLDFVRHGESGDMTVVNTLVPGPDLTDTGEQQAKALVDALSGKGIDEIWDGTPVPQDPGLPTELFVDWRDLITAPQFATSNISEAILGGDSTTIDSAIQAGVSQIDSALTQFPVAVFDDIVSALSGTT